MQTNNDSAAGLVNTDLYGFNDTNGGWHQQSTYVVQGSDAPSVSGQIVEYAKTVSSFSELFVIRDGGATPIQMTSGLANQGASASFGQSFIPGAFQIKWGTEVMSGSGTMNIDYTNVARGLNNFPNNTVAVLLTAQANTRTFNWSSPANTGFTVTASTTGGGFFSWLAIGY
jgi:hypothetical protein